LGKDNVKGGKKKTKWGGQVSSKRGSGQKNLKEASKRTGSRSNQRIHAPTREKGEVKKRDVKTRVVEFTRWKPNAMWEPMKARDRGEGPKRRKVTQQGGLQKK